MPRKKNTEDGSAQRENRQQSTIPEDAAVNAAASLASSAADEAAGETAQQDAANFNSYGKGEMQTSRPALRDRPGEENGGSSQNGSSSQTGAFGDQPARNIETVTDDDVKAAMDRCIRYWGSMKNFNDRLMTNEEYYRQRYSYYKSTDDRRSLPEKGSAYLLNAIINKVADMMDNYPEATILPREESDETTSSLLSKIIPAVLDRNSFKEVYYDCALEMVKNGTAVFGIFWNPLKDNIGEVEIRRIDPLNMRWEPGVKDIQDSKEVFVLAEYDVETLRDLYPEQLSDVTGGTSPSELAHYTSDDDPDLASKAIVYDWYYKKTTAVVIGGQSFPKTVLHYAKFCEGKLLYASENDPTMQDGWYDDGEYPFVFENMYPIKGQPYGFGLIDMMREPQEYIDKLDKALLQNVLANSRPRWFSKEGGGINMNEFMDFNQLIVHYTGDPTSLIAVGSTPLPTIYAEILENKKEELKENAGNRDFSQGTTSGGVTAASAIAALQEASSKTSRTTNQIAYEAFKRVIKMVIERMQQFYTVPRAFRIVENNETQYLQVGVSRDTAGARADMAELRPGSIYDMTLGQYMGGRKPIYDIDIGAEKASPYSRVAQNEFAKELFQLGVFNPQLADQTVPMLQMMDFDDKDKVMQIVSKNQQLYLQNQQMQQLLAGLGGIITDATGDSRIQDMFGGGDATGQQPTVSGAGSGRSLETDQLGNVSKTDSSSQAAQMREETNNRASV